MCAQVATSDEALLRLRDELNRWSNDADGILTQTSATMDVALGEINQSTRRFREKLQALNAKLAALPEDQEPSPLHNEIAKTEGALTRAGQGLAMAEKAVARFQVLDRKVRRTATGLVPGAVADLSRSLSNLERYRDASGTGGSVAGSTTSAARGNSGGGGDSGGGGSQDPYGSAGLTMIDLDQVDFSDNPIRDGFSQKGLGRSDYRWAVDTWETTVRPGVERGSSRNDFAARDQARGASGGRRTADVYDVFMGSNPVTVSRRSDGSLDVEDGRHRVEIARSLGITQLPARMR